MSREIIFTKLFIVCDGEEVELSITFSYSKSFPQTETTPFEPAEIEVINVIDYTGNTIGEDEYVDNDEIETACWEYIKELDNV